MSQKESFKPQSKSEKGVSQRSAQQPEPLTLPVVQPLPQHKTARGVSQRSLLRYQQQRGNRAVQQLLQRQDATPIETQAGLIVEDDAAETSANQLRKSVFLTQLRNAVNATIDETLTGSPVAIFVRPRIDQEVSKYFATYQNHTASALESIIRREAPATRNATTASQLIPPICREVRRAVGQYLPTGNNEASDQSAGGGLIDSISNVLFMADEGGARQPDNPLAVQMQLQGGRGLEGDTKRRMEAGFGRSFADVRLHTDSNASSLSSQMNARAFTVGSDIAFGAGQYQPGTPVGDALLAHELAHTVQQQGANGVHANSVQRNSENVLETQADASAAGVMARIWGNMGEIAREIIPRARTGLSIQRCNGDTPAPSPTPAKPPPIPKTRGPDQHSGAALPTAAQQRDILNELNPGMFAPAPAPAPVGPGPAPAPAPPVQIPWDGRKVGGVVSPAAQRARNALKRKLVAGLVHHLNNSMPGINASASVRRLPTSSFEGPGRAAKSVADKHFGGMTTAAALTPGQRGVRHSFNFSASGPNPNLLDAYDPADRARTGNAISAEAVTWWMVEHEARTVSAMQHHHFDIGNAEEETWFMAEVMPAFITPARRPDLEKYDQFGFAITNSDAGQVVVPTSIDTSLSDVSPGGGVASDAERAALWDGWQLLVHEYIHTLEHPTFNRAQGRGGNPVMREGFCEMFTKEVLDAEIGPAHTDAAIRGEVEGSKPPPPPPSTTLLPNTYTSPPDYLQDRQHAENIRAKIGNEAVKAAFFQGHVEFLGLQPDGSMDPDATARTAPVGNEVSVPSGITNLADLATATGVSEADITAANSGTDLTGALPATVKVPGCREHTVVTVTDNAGRTTARETREQIAAQNGVSEADLVRANPSVSWSSVVAGQKILIPKH